MNKKILRSGLITMSVIVIFITGCTKMQPDTAGQVKDYFPLICDSTYAYRSSTPAGEVSIEEIVVKDFLSSTVKGFYFIDKSELADDVAIITTKMFGLGGAYFKEKNTLYTIECIWKEHLNNVKYSKKQNVLTYPLRINDKKVLSFYDGDLQVTLTVVAFEPVTVLAGTFDNCAKIKMEEIWPEKKYETYIWLAENIGMVKRYRTDGYLDELVSYKKGK